MFLAENLFPCPSRHGCVRHDCVAMDLLFFGYIFSCTNEDSLELVMSLSPNSIRDTLKIMKCFLFPCVGGGGLGD